MSDIPYTLIVHNRSTRGGDVRVYRQDLGLAGSGLAPSPWLEKYVFPTTTVELVWSTGLVGVPRPERARSGPRRREDLSTEQARWPRLVLVEGSRRPADPAPASVAGQPPSTYRIVFQARNELVPASAVEAMVEYLPGIRSMTATLGGNGRAWLVGPTGDRRG